MLCLYKEAKVSSLENHDPGNIEPLSLFPFQSIPIPSKITKCFHIQSPQAWLARHHVQQERTRKVLNLKNSVHIISNQRTQQTRRPCLLFQKGRTLGTELWPDSQTAGAAVEDRQRSVPFLPLLLEAQVRLLGGNGDNTFPPTSLPAA